MVLKAAPALTREVVVGAALAIVDRDGVEALNMRRLGETLGVSAMAVYHHFSDKDEILREISAHLLSGMDRQLPAPEGLGCADWLMIVARSYVSIMREHPKTAPVLLSHPFRVRARHEGELVLAALSSHGVEPGDGITILDGIEAFCLGFGQIAARPSAWLDPEESDLERFPHLVAAGGSRRHSPEEAFELGARSLIEGMLARLTRRAD